MKGKGRPTIYSDELINKICVRLASGESMKYICSDENMPTTSTVYLWLVDGKHPDFSDSYTKAREAQAHNNVDEMLDMRHGLLSGDIDPNAARVVVDIIKWSSERMARKTFSQKETQKEDDTIPQPIAVNITVEDARK